MRWRDSGANITDPFLPRAREMHAISADMSKKDWKNLPEAKLIPALIREVPACVGKMIARSQLSK